MKWTGSFALVVLAFVFTATPAAGQLVPLQTANDPLEETVDATSATLGHASQSDSVDHAPVLTETPVNVESLASGAATSLVPWAPATRSAEGIELGQNVRANLRRFERALESASPRQRERLLLLLDAEIRQVRADGVFPTERRRIARLTRATKTIDSANPVGRSAVTEDPAASTALGGRAAAIAPTAGVLGAAAVGSNPPRGGGVIPSEIPNGWAFPFAFGLLALSIVTLAIAGVAFGLNEERAAS